MSALYKLDTVLVNLHTAVANWTDVHWDVDRSVWAWNCMRASAGCVTLFGLFGAALALCAAVFGLWGLVLAGGRGDAHEVFLLLSFLLDAHEEYFMASDKLPPAEKERRRLRNINALPEAT